METDEPVPDIAKDINAITQHRNQIRGILGGGTCAGNIKLKKRTVKHRIKKVKPPDIPFPDDGFTLK